MFSITARGGGSEGKEDVQVPGTNVVERPPSVTFRRAPASLAAAAAVAAVLSLPDEELDYARAKLALDRIVDPSLDAEWASAELDRLTEAARALAGASQDETASLAALRRIIYESGPWNGYRPFAYDHDHPDGTYLPQKLLHVYLKGRLGNCISMPVLFLILGARLGLNLSLAQAPLHVFVRWQAPTGQILNLETTSGAHPARETWFRQNMAMSDLALRNGLYMRSLPAREGIAAMATTVLEHLLHERRYEEAMGVGDVILKAAPRDAFTMVKVGTACGAIFEDMKRRYPSSHLLPASLRPRFASLAQRNQVLFAAAEALGWEPEE
jgi:regulator of sirC expression with transglutaminase-like and TPR domain